VLALNRYPGDEIFQDIMLLSILQITTLSTDHQFDLLAVEGVEGHWKWSKRNWRLYPLI